MCLPGFQRFEQISEENAIIGYRTWRNKLNSNILMSESQDYEWNTIEGPHEVLNSNSGIYAYNDNYNYYNYNNYYYLFGIIKQYGKTAIHSTGQRSEYARVDTLFTIRLSDAKGPKEFLDWISVFNAHIEDIAKRYNAKTMHYQDFVESRENK